eukprot:1136936-Pelagomonas_calceolata.AAC.1
MHSSARHALDPMLWELNSSVIGMHLMLCFLSTVVLLLGMHTISRTLLSALFVGHTPTGVPRRPAAPAIQSPATPQLSAARQVMYTRLHNMGSCQQMGCNSTSRSSSNLLFKEILTPDCGQAMQNRLVAACGCCNCFLEFCFADTLTEKTQVTVWTQVYQVPHHCAGSATFEPLGSDSDEAIAACAKAGVQVSFMLSAWVRSGQAKLEGR